MTATAATSTGLSPYYLGDKLAWDRDRLIVTDEELLNRLRRPYLSASTANSMESSPARWAAEKALPRGDNPFGAAELGTSAHAVLEDLYALPPFARTESRAMTILLAQAEVLWPGQSPETLAKKGMWISAVAAAYKGLWAIENPKTVSVRDREFKVDAIDVGGVPFVGFIDRIDQCVEGSKIVDYKSSAKMPGNITRFGDHHGDQLRLYSEAMRVIDGEMPIEAGLSYIRLGKYRSVPLSKAKMNGTLAAFRKAWKRFQEFTETGSFPCEPGPLCGWCVLVNACPIAKAHGFADRTGLAPSAVELGIPTIRKMDDANLNKIAAKKNRPKAPDTDDDFGSASVNVAVVDPEANVREVIVDEIHAAKIITEFGSTVEPESNALAVPETPEPVPFKVPDALIDLPALGADTTEIASPTDSESGRELPDAAHLPGVGDETDETAADPGRQEEEDMTLLKEDKPWFETVQGTLNPGSYAATAVFGTTTLAYEQLSKAGVALTKAAIDGLAQTFAYIVGQAQDSYTGSTSFQDSMNSRLRGALRTILDVKPLPFGGSEADWDEWVATALKHSKSIAAAALRLYDEPMPEKPWTALAIRDTEKASA